MGSVATLAIRKFLLEFLKIIHEMNLDAHK